MWRGRCGELREVGQTKAPLDVADLLHGLLIAVCAELLAFDLFKLVAYLIQLLGGERLLPGGKEDRILACRVVLIHQHQRFQGLCELFGRARVYLCAPRQGEYVVGDLTPTLVLYDENIRQAGRWTARPFDRREDVRLFQLFLMLVFAEGPKQLGGFL